MKKHTWLLFALIVGIIACKNESKDSVEKADSANEAKLDSPAAPQSIVADEKSASFLVKAANVGMMEAQLGELAQQKATNEKVKEFGSLLSKDHHGVNNQVKALAAQRNISLPSAISDDNARDQEDIGKKSGADFDKAFMRSIIKDHDDAIDLFEKASNNVKDAEVKAFADNTLPTLRNHLESAKAVQKALNKS